MFPNLFLHSAVMFMPIALFELRKYGILSVSDQDREGTGRFGFVPRADVPADRHRAKGQHSFRDIFLRLQVDASALLL
jgi:hypothetical protein